MNRLLGPRAMTHSSTQTSISREAMHAGTKTKFRLNAQILTPSFLWYNRDMLHVQPTTLCSCVDIGVPRKTNPETRKRK